MPNYKSNNIYNSIKSFFQKKNANYHHLSNPVFPSNDLSDEWSARDTLVGVLRNASQLDIALENKFYHIPAKYISEYNLPLKYVAIYQSKNLFRNQAGIYYFGEITSCRCIKRKYINELPKNSNEYYYRFDVKNWKTLQNPIEAKELGFIRIFTNYEMMLNSTEIPQLLLKNKSLHDIYCTIKSAITSVQNKPELAPIILEFNNRQIYIELDDILIYKHNRPVSCFSTYDFMDLPNTIITQIYKHINT